MWPPGTHLSSSMCAATRRVAQERDDSSLPPLSEEVPEDQRREHPRKAFLCPRRNALQAAIRKHHKARNIIRTAHPGKCRVRYRRVNGNAFRPTDGIERKKILRRTATKTGPVHRCVRVLSERHRGEDDLATIKGKGHRTFVHVSLSDKSSLHFHFGG